MQKHGLSRRATLTEAELEEIGALASVCHERDALEMRLNWDMLRSRSGNVSNDFLYYEEGELLGYLALYSFNRQEAEMTGMVHPDHRREGIFRMLFMLASGECKQRGIPKLVLFFDHTSSSGKAFADVFGAAYRTSEYKMKLLENVKAQVSAVNDQLRIRNAQPADSATLAHITAVSFEMVEADLQTEVVNDVRNPNRHVYLAELDGRPIGQINVVYGHGALIYGFGVLPAYRGRGYGRAILAWTVEQVLADKQWPIALEVETTNRNALGLYHSCGFRETHTFDYYEVEVR